MGGVGDCLGCRVAARGLNVNVNMKSSWGSAYEEESRYAVVYSNSGFSSEMTNNELVGTTDKTAADGGKL